MEVNAVDRESAVPCDAHPCKRGVGTCARGNVLPMPARPYMLRDKEESNVKPSFENIQKSC
jgi:hypothetical protein